MPESSGGLRWKDQTSFIPGPGDAATTGNCLQACLASLLDVNLEDVPNFAAIEGDVSEWFLAMVGWLGDRGLGVWVYYTEGQPQWYGSPGTLGIISAKSPRGDFQHSVIGYLTEDGWQLEHDPHPSREGTDGHATEIWIIHALDPARSRQALSMSSSDAGGAERP